MNRPLAVLAALLSAFALYAPTRTQAFVRVNVDGRGTRMLVAGRGKPTVVFESGFGGPLENWGRVQPEVSRFARTVSYDRAGVGLSEEGPRPRDGRRIAIDLRRALQAARIDPPYILVGASLGGRFIRVFAGMYPEDVAGLVLVDPTPDNEGVADVRGYPELESLAATLDQARTSRVAIGTPVFLIGVVPPLEVPFATAGIRALRMSRRAALAAEPLAHRQWLDTIPGSRFIVTDRSGHNIAQEEPTLVIATIREAVDQTKRGSRP